MIERDYYHYRMPITGARVLPLLDKVAADFEAFVAREGLPDDDRDVADLRRRVKGQRMWIERRMADTPGWPFKPYPPEEPKRPAG